MASIPTGTVTFLFTDIEGSTRLAQQFSEAWPLLQARHHSLLRRAITDYHGYIFRIIGDEFNAAFLTARDALLAAVTAQRGLQREDWGAAGSLRVRMGLHTGPATSRGDDYDGYLTLSHVKRLMAAAHGGQIVLSEATETLMRDGLPADVSLRDLGEQRLKDFERAEHVFQVVAPDLPADFPPLPTLVALFHNLPAQLTNFIGRTRALAEVNSLLASTRLLTLTGPGGTGKTRLALQLAAGVAEQFPDGVWLVELAALTDPALVSQTVASTVGLQEHQGRTPVEALVDFLRAKTSLLLLDNCEHLIEACAQLADTLLHACPRLKILASSREALGIGGEVSYRVPPLSLPAGTDVTQSEAVQLFVERAKAAQPAFMLTEQNASAVAQICQRLDGIPLAIELAAARVRVFSPEQIAARLDDRFRLLTGGNRTALPRQQTLQALIDWSYDLLSERECVLLRRLSVFGGGWTYEAAEAVCGDDETADDGPLTVDEGQTTNDGRRTTESAAIGRRELPSAVYRLPSVEVLDLITHLVDKSLVLTEEQQSSVRYRLLETIRQYARDKLLASGESESVRDRHLNYFVGVTNRAPQRIYDFGNREWADLFDQELDNIRAALEWALVGKLALAMHMLGSMGTIWATRGLVFEGRRWCEQALAQTQNITQPELVAARAKVYLALASLVFAQGDADASRRASDESLKLYRELGRPPEMLDALGMRVSASLFLGELELGRTLAEELLTLARALSDQRGESMAMVMLARLSAVQGKYEEVAAYGEQAVLMARQSGSLGTLAMALAVSGMVVAAGGDYARARARLEESHSLYRELHNDGFTNVTRSELANVARLTGDTVRALQLYRETIHYWQHIGQRAGIARCLECLAFMAGASADYERSAHLFGAAEALRAAAQAQMTPDEQVEYALQLQQIRARTDESQFNAAWAEARALTVEQAVALAMEDSHV